MKKRSNLYEQFNAVSEKIKRYVLPIATIPVILSAAQFLLPSHFNYLTFFIPFSIFSVSAALWMFSRTSAYKALFRALSLIFLFHCLVFPFSYLVLLKNDSESLIIDDDVFQSVNKNAYNELLVNYQPAVTDTIVRVINECLKDKSAINKDANLVDNKNLLKCANYFLRLDIMKTAEIRYLAFNAYNMTGNRLFEVNIRQDDLPDGLVYNRAIKDYLQFVLQMQLKKKQDFFVEQEKIKKKDVWTFNRILPYSLNIFNSKSIKPVSALANIIVTLHQFSVILIGFGIVAALVRDIFVKNNS